MLPVNTYTIRSTTDTDSPALLSSKGSTAAGR